MTESSVTDVSTDDVTSVASGSSSSDALSNNFSDELSDGMSGSEPMSGMNPDAASVVGAGAQFHPHARARAVAQPNVAPQHVTHGAANPAHPPFGEYDALPTPPGSVSGDVEAPAPVPTDPGFEYAQRIVPVSGGIRWLEALNFMRESGTFDAADYEQMYEASVRGNYLGVFNEFLKTRQRTVVAMDKHFGVLDDKILRDYLVGRQRELRAEVAHITAAQEAAAALGGSR